MFVRASYTSIPLIGNKDLICLKSTQYFDGMSDLTSYYSGWQKTL